MEATQVEMCGLADLDDLNTENPVVRQALRDSYGWWIKTVGVDGFRLDVARHVPHLFWHDFFHRKDAKVPGIHSVAAARSHCDFLSFGGIILTVPNRMMMPASERLSAT